MPVARRAQVGSATTTAVTHLDTVIPASGPGGTVAAGDEAWFFTGHNVSLGAMPTPSGWTLVSSQTYSTTFESLVYHKVLVSGDLGATVTLTPVASQRMGADMVIYSGVDGYNAINFYVQPNTGATNTHANPTVSSTDTGVTLSAIVERSSAADTGFTVPSGMTAFGAGGFGTGNGAIVVQVADNLTEQASGSTLGGDVWTGAAGVTNNPIITWTVALSTSDTPTAVGKSVQFLANTRSIVNDTITLRHNTRNIVGDGWTGDVNDILNGLYLSESFNVLFGAAQSVVGKNLGLVYKVRTTIGKNINYVFNAGGTVGKDLNSVFNTRSARGNQFSYVLNVTEVGGVGRDLGLLWKVLNPATNQLTLRYNVAQLLAITAYALEIDGLNVRTEAYNVTNRSGRLGMPALRGDDLVIAGRSGYAFVPGKAYEAGHGVLSVWVTGANTNGTVPGTFTGRQAQFQQNFALMQRLFMRNHRLSTIRAGQPDGTFRVAQVQWKEWGEPDVQAGGTRAEWTIGFEIPDVFWEDESPSTDATPQNSTLPKTLDLTHFANMTGLIEDAVFSVSGPITNPRITETETGNYVELQGTLVAGETWTVDSGNGTSNKGAASVLANTRNSGYRLLTISTGSILTNIPRLVLSGSSAGSATKLSVTAKRKWVTG